MPVPSPSLSVRRKLFFGLGTVLLPFLAIIAFEGILHLANYGYNPHFFLKEPGSTTVRTNPRFSSRFFPPQLARAPENLRIPIQKSPGTRRIFVLGESAAQGVPLNEYSFSRQLDVLLRAAYPQEKFEVFNLASTAINSHVVRIIAQEAVALEPDLFIVYLGNNEVVGPYGPGTVLSRFNPNLTFIRASLWAKGTRIGQLLNHLAARFRPRTNLPSKWEGMEMFVDHQIAKDDSRLPAVYDHFTANLRDIIRSGRGAKAQVLLCTVAVNIADTPPFASLDGSDALSLYDEGRKQAAAGKIADARTSLLAARDADALRFRADSGLNRRITLLASDFLGDPGVHFLDLAALLGADGATPGTPLPGYNFFFEHVHFNWNGNYAVASHLFKQIPLVFPELLEGGKRSSSLPDNDVAMQRLGFGDYGRSLQLQNILPIISRPPFTGQPGNLAHVNTLTSEKATLDKALASGTLAQAAENIAQAHALYPTDPVLTARLGLIRLEQQRPAEALKLLETAFELQPMTDETLWALGRTHLALHDFTKAENCFLHAIVENPFNLNVRLELAALRTRQQDYNGAAEALTAAHAQFPREPIVLCEMANLSLTRGRREEAENHLRDALRLDPAQAQALNLLIHLLAARGREADFTAFEKNYFSAHPDSLTGHLAFSEYYIKRTHLAEALPHLQAASRLTPADASLRYRLVGLLAALNRWSDAIPELEAILSQSPDFHPAMNDLAWILATRKTPLRNPARALELINKAIAIVGENLPPHYLGTLSAAQAANNQFPAALTTIIEARSAAERSGRADLVKIYERYKQHFDQHEPIEE